jgi:exocyst complex protein 7
VETISAVLTQDTSYNQTLLRLPRKISVSERGHALVGIYIKKVLVQLNLTLVNKSDTYQDPFLKAVFRLNNNQYILKSIQRSGLLEVVKLAEPDCEEHYLDMILEQKRLYSQSWARVLGFIWSADDIPVAILQAPGKLDDRYCRTIKEKYAGFNKEIDEISGTQKSYSIPDVELRESLKRDNKEYICPKYNGFYEKYANVPFTKNHEKYVRYTPAQVSSLIDSFFDAAA